MHRCRVYRDCLADEHNTGACVPLYGTADIPRQYRPVSWWQGSSMYKEFLKTGYYS